MKKVITFFVALILCFNVKAQTSLTEAVDFYSIDDYEREIHLFDILDEGKFVFMYFFFSDAESSPVFDPCVAEAYHYFGDNQDDVFFIGIAPTDDSLKIDGWRETYGVDFPVIHWFTEGSTAQEICEDYGVQIFSTAVFIAPNREILINNIWPINSGQQLIDEFEAAMATTGITENNENNYSLYPNPTNGSVTINSDSSRNVVVNIYDMMGHLVRNISISDHNTTIELNDINRGVYLVDIDGKFEKLIVE